MSPVTCATAGLARSPQGVRSAAMLRLWPQNHAHHSSGFSRGILFLRFSLAETVRIMGSPEPSVSRYLVTILSQSASDNQQVPCHYSITASDHKQVPVTIISLSASDHQSVPCHYTITYCI